MSVNSGQIVRFQCAQLDFDPFGDWTIRESRIKKEHKESTRQGNHYFAEIAQEGMVSGQIAIRADQDTTPLTTANEATVLVETPSGIVYNGTMSYTADADNAINDGNLQVELIGTLTQLP